ncbi:MAG: type II toxin-antitoxin system HicB family antitoxin [Candidatus Micrarchaeota archaeon]|nr:type II toxin-antitoxin system HicB family antitoxin [Candidatus Micrarchaeota archaeon]
MKLQTVIWKEDKTYVIKEAITGVTTQGKSIEEAMKNIKEAVSLYLEEMPSARRELKRVTAVGAVSVEVA